MGRLLETLQTAFTFVIIDSAPLLPITDTVQLATKVEGVVLVIKGQGVSSTSVRQAYNRLDYVKAKILGVILNNIDIQNPEYKDYRKSYVAYYESYNTDHK
jgi:Mrp family chromosome partitioning ATPase